MPLHMQLEPSARRLAIFCIIILSRGGVPNSPGKISHQIPTFFFIVVLRMNWWVSQPEERSCTVARRYGTKTKSALFHSPHITVINLSWPQIDTWPHCRASCEQLCLEMKNRTKNMFPLSFTPLQNKCTHWPDENLIDGRRFVVILTESTQKITVPYSCFKIAPAISVGMALLYDDQ